MSTSYQPKDSAVQGLQLKVQELVCTSSDSIVSSVALVSTIDFKQPISEIRSVVFADNSAVTLTMIDSTKYVLSGNTLACTLPFALAANDSITVKFVA